MKLSHKVLAVLSVSMTLGAANTASASDVAGFGPCYLEQKLLRNNGFDTQKTYSPSEIAALVKRDGIIVHGIDKLDPQCRYNLIYKCGVAVETGLVHSAVFAKAYYVTKHGKRLVDNAVITWEQSSPLTDHVVKGMSL